MDPGTALPSDPAPPTDADAAWRAHRQQSREHAFVLTDLEGRVLTWDGAAERLLGHAARDIVGRSLDEVFTPEDRALGVPRHERAVALSGARSEDDRWHLRRDGTRVWLSGTMEVVRGPQGDAVALAKVMRDRTDLRMQVDTLEARVRAATADSAERSAFLASLVNELRSVLGPLANATSLLHAPGHGDRGHFAAAMLHRQLDLVQRLVADLEDLSRHGRPGTALRRERVDLAQLVVQVVDAVALQPAAAGIACQALVPEGDGTTVHVDADRAHLHQGLYHLVDRAIGATPAGGRVWVKLTVEGPDAVLRVEDTGRGIPHAALPQVLAQLTQAGGDAPAGEVDAALHAAHRVVAAHGGSLEAKSEGRDRGSTITVRLPVAPA